MMAAGVKPDSSADGIVQGNNVRNVNGFRLLTLLPTTTYLNSML